MSTPGRLDVRSAKQAEKPLLAALMQDYLAEFDTFDSVERNADGSYSYPYLDHYWQDPNRYPFLFRVDDELAGFALIRFEADPLTGQGVMHLAEFFVTKPFRRQGVGTAAAIRLWDLFPGKWSLMVLASNKNAYPFWQQAVGNYSRGNYTEQRPQQAIGGAYTFTFMSETDADLPDDIDPEIYDF